MEKNLLNYSFYFLFYIVYNPTITQPLVAPVKTNSKDAVALSKVKLPDTPIIKLPLAPKIQVFTPDKFDILTESPIDGDAGSVKVRSAVST